MGEAAFNGLAVFAVEVEATEIGVCRTAMEEVIDDDEDTVADGHDCLLPAASDDESAVLGSKIAILRAARRVGGLDKRAAQPWICLAGATTVPLSSTLIIAWTHTRP